MTGLLDLQSHGGPIAQHQRIRVIAQPRVAQGRGNLFDRAISSTTNECAGLEAAAEFLPCERRSDLTQAVGTRRLFLTAIDVVDQFPFPEQRLSEVVLIILGGDQFHG